MDEFYLDELALLRAFIEHKTLSYTDVQEKGIVPVLNKQDRRVLFKSCIEKFKKWEVIQVVPDAHPVAWNVVPDKAETEYNRLVRAIEQQQMIEKYSFQHLHEEVQLHSRKLTRISLFRVLAVVGCVLAAFNFLTGLSLPALFTLLKNLWHTIQHH